MAIDYQKAMSLDIAPVEYSYTQRDTMLYALGLGLGANPLDANELRYVYEKDLRVFPTMPVVQAFVPLRSIDLGINHGQMVHGEQGLTLHAPLPTAGTVIGKTRVTEIVDRGAGKGAIVYLERCITDKATGSLLASTRMSAFCRADGGFGGPVTRAPAAVTALPEPQRAADHVVDYSTLPQLALIYRLSADMNPLHAEPEFAARAGFPRPILHGLATFGIVGRAVVAAVLQNDNERFGGLSGRFSAPVYPGETIRVEMWREEGAILLRASVPERGIVVFSNGMASFRG